MVSSWKSVSTGLSSVAADLAPFRRGAVALALVCLFVEPLSLRGQEADGMAEPVAETVPGAQAAASNVGVAVAADIPLEELNLLLKPLTVSELEGEAEAWREWLRRVLEQLSELEIARLKFGRAPGEGGEAAADGQASGRAALDAEIEPLRLQQIEIAERLGIVLEALERKGGDATEYRSYLAAVSQIVLDEGSSVRSLVVAWLRSPSGGILFLKRVAQFLGILVVAWLAAALLSGIVARAMERTEALSQLLRRSVVAWVRWGTLLIGLVIGLSSLVDIGPLLALLGAAGFAVGFALRDSLSNFASGLLLLLYQPFDVGDAVEVAGVSGIVDSMNLAETKLRTFDNKVVVLPNNDVFSGTIVNATHSDRRRVDMKFGISYEDDMDQAMKILEEIVRDHPLVLEEPVPVIRVHELADSSVNIICRPWSKTEDLWTVFWDVTKRAKERFDEEGVSIPFPQRDVHLRTPQRDSAKAGSMGFGTDAGGQ